MPDQDRVASEEARRRDGPAATAHEHPDEAGAYIGRFPERVVETIPGGVRPDDERISAYGSSSDEVPTDDGTPGGHREGRPADDASVREAGQDR